ncbi:MAG: tRNA 2-thiouridine(34) synthase MnmA [Deltaproteobacteria bacterium]|nr:tRNA 2-thiouridine(34) synthase MnmA [Deltaproteobacteria bacterium]
MRAVVAMSGGVDSSVAALLLRRRGLEVIGLSMRLWDGRADAGGSGCCGVDDIGDARRVASRLDIPFYAVNFKNEFERVAVRPFVSEYLAGRTPSPCIVCNERLKFDLLQRRARELGADVFATGHYARVCRNGTRFELRRAKDHRRDQSYFLFTLDQARLNRAEFPLSEMTKDEVRAIAAREGLPVAVKPDSQETCFVPPGGYAAFVASQAPGDFSGEIVDTSGKTLGQHKGYFRYTIGQRRGTGLAFGSPRYVTAIDAARRIVTIGGNDDLLSTALVADGASWVAGSPPVIGAPCTVRIRSTHRGVPARVFPSAKGFRVEFESPVRAVAPGQAAVLYDGDRVLGGGWIREAAAAGRR